MRNSREKRFGASAPTVALRSRCVPTRWAPQQADVTVNHRGDKPERSTGKILVSGVTLPLESIGEGGVAVETP